MSDFKSKLPDLNELGGMMSKLFTDVKKSVLEIADDYKAKRQENAEKPNENNTPPKDE